MSWAAVAGAAVGVVGGVIQNNKSKSAANAQQAGYDAAARESGRQYDQTRQDMQPWLGAGTNALAQMQQLNSGDFRSFKQSPDYEFAFSQGLQGLDRSAAARGSLYSGGADADRMAFGQGLASQQYGNYYNRLASLAGVGQQTAGQIGQFGQQNALNQGGAAIGVGNARASAYQQQGHNTAQMVGAVGGGFNNWYQNNLANNPGGTGWYLGNNPGRG